VESTTQEVFVHPEGSVGDPEALEVADEEVVVVVVDVDVDLVVVDEEVLEVVDDEPALTYI
jgi:hypothetical protein